MPLRLSSDMRVERLCASGEKRSSRSCPPGSSFLPSRSLPLRGRRAAAARPLVVVVKKLSRASSRPGKNTQTSRLRLLIAEARRTLLSLSLSSARAHSRCISPRVRDRAARRRRKFRDGSRNGSCVIFSCANAIALDVYQSGFIRRSSIKRRRTRARSARAM